MTRSAKAMGAIVAFGISLAACGGVPADSALDHILDLDHLKQLVVGNTLSGENDDGTTFTEFYLPDGTIHGEDNQAEKYDGKYNFRLNMLCLDYEGTDNDGCVRVSVDGDQVLLIKNDRVLTTVRNLKVLPGNPRNF